MKRAFHVDLLGWFHKHRRDLPWRRTRDPYAITVSEFMCQQTQITTVLPYYQRWMQALPNWDALARAQPEQVLKLWEGLGYYRRARLLHALAIEVCTHHQGNLPMAPGALEKLPGIGPYTAGAIRSIAWQQPSPLVDGNVERVLCRVFNIQASALFGPTRRSLWQLASCLIRSLPKDSLPGEFNQALMELGALVCTPRQPQCLLCPLQPVCRAHNPEALSQKSRPTIIRESITYALLKDADKIWLQSPGDPGRWSALHRLPVWDSSWIKPDPRPDVPLYIAKLTFSITRYRVDAHLRPGLIHSSPKPKGAWHPLADLDVLPLPAPHRKLLHLAQIRPTHHNSSC